MKFYSIDNKNTPLIDISAYIHTVHEDKYETVALALNLFFVVFSATKPSVFRNTARNNAIERIFTEFDHEVL